MKTWLRIALDGAYLLFMALMVGLPLSVVAWGCTLLGGGWSVPLRWLAVPFAALVFLLVLLVEIALVARLMPALRPGRYPFPGSAQATAWMLRLSLQRVAYLPLWVNLFQSSSLLRWACLHALGATVSFDVDTAWDVSLLDPSLLEIGKGCMVAARVMTTCHIVEQGHIVLGRVILKDGVQVQTGVQMGPGVTIGAHSTLGPLCKILPDVTVGEDVHVGMETVLHSGVRIGNNVVIGHGVIIEANASIGEGARLRSGARVGKGFNVAAGERYPPPNALREASS